jgi:two-component system LytT family sensor kinase
MKINRLPVYYIFGWILYTLYLYVDNVLANRGSVPYVWSNLLASFMEFTFCFFVVYPKWLKMNKIHFLFLGLVAADAIFVSSRALIEEVAYVGILGHGNYTADTKVLYYIKDNWWRALQPLLFSFLAWSLVDTFKKEKETALLKQEKIQTELLFLKTQINPHFLYNTLNYLYALAYPVSGQLADGIIKLSQLMRYMLHNSTDGMLALQQEIDYLTNYIALYQLRFEDHFFLDLKTEGNFEGKKIASLILIPFIENAFKHGVMNDEKRPIKIHLKLTGNLLSLIVSNRIHRGQKDQSSGIGLVNTQRRLELIYPDKHELRIANNGETYKTTLTIQLSELTPST